MCFSSYDCVVQVILKKKTRYHRERNTLPGLHTMPGYAKLIKNIIVNKIGKFSFNCVGRRRGVVMNVR